MTNYLLIKRSSPLLFFGLLTLLISCGDNAASEEKGATRLSIVTTTGMIEDIVKNIVKDSADVQSLMGPGVDPHLYKATQGDLKRLREADVIFYNGLHLEGKLQEIFEKLNNMKPVLAVSADIPSEQLINNTTMGGQHDPHIWFDVSLWQQAAMYVADALIDRDSTNATFYEINAATYIFELQQLHFEVGKRISEIPNEQRILITAHDAFEYFGRAYSMQVRGLQGISTMSEFGLKDVADLVNFIVDNKIKAVFVESSVPEKYIRSVVEGCNKKGHNVEVGGTLYSDAMGANDTPEGTYQGMVRKNVTTIVNALK